jgi:hypothetical protein
MMARDESASAGTSKSKSMLVHCCGIETMSGSAPEYMQKLIDTHEGVSACARCGGTHESMSWVALDNPVVSAPEGVTPSAVIGYAMCPVSGQPIFLTAWDMGDDEP